MGPFCRSESFQYVRGSLFSLALCRDKVHVLLSGYPCCSISAQNNHPKSFLDPESKTGSGYDSMIKYVKKNKRKLLLILLENVKNMLHKRKQFDDEEPMRIQRDALSKEGFQCIFSCLCSSADYGLAQQRSRSWSLFVRNPSVRLGAFQIYVSHRDMSHTYSSKFTGQVWLMF